MASTYAPCSQCGSLNRAAPQQGRVAVCGKCGRDLPLHGSVVELTQNTLPLLIEKSPLPVVVDFWAPWCGPCRAFAPTFEAAAPEFLGRVVFAKVNTEAHPHVGAKFGIRGIPTLAYFQAGAEKDRVSGALPPDAFREWLNAQR